MIMQEISFREIFKLAAITGLLLIEAGIFIFALQATGLMVDDCCKPCVSQTATP